MWHKDWEEHIHKKRELWHADGDLTALYESGTLLVSRVNFSVLSTRAEL